MTTREILLGAAEYIATKGWTQGVYMNGHSCCCVIGACKTVAKVEASEIERGHVGRLLELQLGVPHDNASGVIAWNDTEGRTKQEVIDLLRNAAESA